MKELNKDWKKRDSLIWGDKPPHYIGGVAYFVITPNTLEVLIEEGFANPEEKQNDSYTIEEFLKFCNKYPGYDLTLHGYAVSQDRPDYRVTIEGIEYLSDIPIYKKLQDEFESWFDGADDFICDSRQLYCWYD